MVEFVCVFEHREVQAETARIAWTTPRGCEWEASWRAPRCDARQLLADATPAA